MRALSPCVTFAVGIALVISARAENHAPVIQEIPNKSVAVCQPLAFTIGASDPDLLLKVLPLQKLSFALLNPPRSPSFNTNTGAFYWIPTEVGNFTFTVKVSDNGIPVLSATNQFTVTVTNVAGGNKPPVLAVIRNKAVKEMTTLRFRALAADPNPGQIKTFTMSGAPSGATIQTNGVFSWTPTETQGPGLYTCTIRVTDSGTPALWDEQQFSITVLDINTPPLIAPIAPWSLGVCQTLRFTPLVTDSDIPAQQWSYALVAPPAGATINTNTGEFTWTPNATGTATLKLKVRDNGTPPLSAIRTFAVTVTNRAGGNLPPVLSAISNKSVNEMATLTFTAIGRDPNQGQTLTYSLLGQPNGASINPNTGVFSWTPVESQGPGAYSFIIRVADNGSPSLWDEQRVTVVVRDVNTAPLLASIANRSATINQAMQFAITASDTDLPAQKVVYALVTPPSGAAINSTNGTFTWTPRAAGSFLVKVKVTDNGSPALAAIATFTISVTNPLEQNHAPVLAAIENKTASELTALTFTATATDQDAGQVLTYTLVNQPAGATITPAGVFNWTPSESQGGAPYTFVVRVTDNGNPAKSAEKSVTVTVNEINSAPVLNPITNKSMGVNQPVVFTATATDSDVPAQTLTFGFAAPNAGATISSAGAFSWTPSATGLFIIKIKVTDNGSPAKSATNEFSISVTNVPIANSAPVLAAIANKTVNEQTALTFTATATDPDVMQSLTYSLVNQPTGATITSAGYFNWTPTEAQGGSSYTFKVRVTDNGSPSKSDEKSLTVTVNKVNSPPTLSAVNPVTMNVGETVTFNASAADSDVPAQSLTFALVAPIQTGAAMSTAGHFSWTPTAGGSYTIKFKVTDNGSPALSVTNSVSITVNASTRLEVQPTLDNVLIFSTTDNSAQNTVYFNSALTVGNNWAFYNPGGIGYWSCVAYDSALLFDVSQIYNRTVVKATLKLWPLPGLLPADVNTKYEVNAFSGQWQGNSITFANQPDVHPDFAVLADLPVYATVPVEWDVTAVVQRWANRSWNNYGFLLLDHINTEPSYGVAAARFCGFASVENSDIAKRPKLIIDYR